MSSTRRNRSASAVAALMLIAACDRPSTDAANDAAGESSSAMPSMRPAAQATEHLARGTVDEVDQAAGTINISHGPVASANWPAMKMSFKLEDPEAASDVAPGQRVEFRFTIQSGMDATVTEIERVE